MYSLEIWSREGYILVAATNANESKIRNYYNTDLKDKHNDKTRDNVSRDNKFTDNYKSREGNKLKDYTKSNELSNIRNNFKTNEYRSRDEYKTNRYKYKENGVKQRDTQDPGKSAYNYGKSKEFSRPVYLDKDEDNDNRFKNHRSADTKAKSSQGKDKEQTTDKLETIKRLEREKKAIQKKNRDEELEKQKKPLMKSKKNKTINWTKGYECGLLDEDEDYSEYM